MVSTTPTKRPTPTAVARGFLTPPKPSPRVDDDGLPPGRPSTAAPASIRVTLWLVYLVRFVTVAGLIRGLSRLGRRLIVWVLMLYPKLYGLTIAVTGGRVGKLEKLERDEVCLRCSGLVVRQRVGYFASPGAPRHYCGPCGCGEWYLSRLIRGRLAKNWWRKHYCPRELHPQTNYPQFITISPGGCGQAAFKIPGGRAHGRPTD